MISVSLPEWMIWLQQQTVISYITLPALCLFLAIYAITKWRMEKRESYRLKRLNSSLKLYASATGPLIRGAESLQLPTEEQQLLMDVLLECRAAPYITSDLLGQINAYAHDQDNSRLTLLLKTIERESDRLIEEQDKLLHRIETPGWGYSLWKQIYPAIPFLFALALFYLFGWLIQLLFQMSSPQLGLSDLLSKWSLFGSALFSLILLYPALMNSNRPTASSFLLKVWSIIIALLFLFHLINPMFAPYILVVQMILFLIGFRFTGNRSRKSRPFAGHYPMPNTESTDEEASAPGSELEASPSHYVHDQENRPS
ncbi:hypothetical protein SAMN04488542_13427 [Fontibacillus panacisegetis]|uniref:Uncharacterized protein n=1 Tax=Fontibacillus panacisegetis TaxID=670482 RepID=A0A1G7T5F9_9BACL|nr:hypothetical protein [Fontibacillus panacisegetis]SDG30264.1 hypothetical protein SAMN04488542_13427 [Fontibacillus panacisegetis]